MNENNTNHKFAIYQALTFGILMYFIMPLTDFDYKTEEFSYKLHPIWNIFIWIGIGFVSHYTVLLISKIYNNKHKKK